MFSRAGDIRSWNVNVISLQWVTVRRAWIRLLLSTCPLCANAVIKVFFASFFWKCTIYVRFSCFYNVSWSKSVVSSWHSKSVCSTAMLLSCIRLLAARQCLHSIYMVHITVFSEESNLHFFFGGNRSIIYQQAVCIKNVLIRLDPIVSRVAIN